MNSLVNNLNLNNEFNNPVIEIDLPNNISQILDTFDNNINSSLKYRSLNAYYK